MKINNKLILNIGIFIGISLYLSRLMRESFNGYATLLFWSGFIPNFGLSFALPLVYVKNRTSLKAEISVKHFHFACIVTLVIMVLNEIVDVYQPKRVFDTLDIYASFVGVLIAFLLYHLILKNTIYQES